MSMSASGGQGLLGAMNRQQAAPQMHMQIQHFQQMQQQQQLQQQQQGSSELDSMLHVDTPVSSEEGIVGSDQTTAQPVPQLPEPPHNGVDDSTTTSSQEEGVAFN